MYYNSLQYALRVWLTSALVIPHLYLVYYIISESRGAYFPLSGYIELVLIIFLLSMPVGFLFMICTDRICATHYSLKIKKFLAWCVLQILLLILFTIVTYSFGNVNWASCLDLLIICSFTIAMCINLYKLKPLSANR